MNKITCMRIDGTKYNVAMLTAQTLAQLVIDVDKAKDVRSVCKKYGVLVV